MKVKISLVFTIVAIAVTAVREYDKIVDTLEKIETKQYIIIDMLENDGA